jgi:iron only hydrogenase large subunit-like protein
MPGRPQFVHAHRVDPQRCRGHMVCMRRCPTQAIRVRDGTAEISDELCVDCGSCIANCPEGAIVPVVPPYAGIFSYRHRVAIPTGALYSQFEPSVHPYVIHLAIKRLGFDEVVDVAPTSALLARVLVRIMQRAGARLPLISSYCPSTVRLIQVKYPGLVEHIVPLDVPRELTAREIRRTRAERLGLKPEEIGILYISPCLAKIVSILQPAEKDRSHFDAVVSIRDIYPLLRPHVHVIKERFDESQVPPGFYFSAGWATFGGLTRAVQGENWLAVSGIDQLIHILDDIENSKLRHVDFIEALACMLGCSGGTLNVESPYVARANSIKQRVRYEGVMELDDDAIERQLGEGYFDLQRPIRPRPTRYLDTDIQTSLKRMREIERLYGKLRQNDCGCCGAPTCLAFAEDCARGGAELTDCIFLHTHETEA